MNKYILLYIGLMLSLLANAQIVKSGQKFEKAYLHEGELVFLKEIDASSKTTEAAYDTLKLWAVDNYAKDHFFSNVNYDKKNKEVTIKSRVELILPTANKEGEREKVMMRYELSLFVFKDMCVMEISNIVFIHDEFKKYEPFNRILKAEFLITKEVLAMDDSLKDFRKDIEISTIFFFNQLASELEEAYGNQKLIDN